jgi:2-polyprenyl-3-methyl-5-hydroxy-6-metoxy-1,4-benzoquinol methylase
MKILVAITSYGTANDQYLLRVIDEYRTMPFAVDVVVFSNLNKKVPQGAEIVVGLPTSNPWSLPFAHKKILAERLERYDLFIYSEDDILITEGNVRSFWDLASQLPNDEIPGFLRFEVGPDGERSYPDFHVNFHWQPGSVKFRDRHTLGFFTNDHSGCYILTQRQLRRAIESGGFLVGPHRGAHDLACTAATDPYTQCGLKKLVSISHVDDFLVRHLSDKYAGTYGIKDRDFRNYLNALLLTKANEQVPVQLNTDSASIGRLFSKDYYEPVRHELISPIPDSAHTVLSIGCGWGATEEWLARTGRRVIVSALNPVMSRWAESRGLEVLSGDWVTAQEKLAREPIDCLLISNVLHLAADPPGLLSSLAMAMPSGCTVVAAVPSLGWAKVIWKRIHDRKRCRYLGDFDKTKVHVTSRRTVLRWFDKAGILVERTWHRTPERLGKADRLTGGVFHSLLSSEMLVRGRTKKVSQPALHSQFCTGPRSSGSFKGRAEDWGLPSA